MKKCKLIFSANNKGFGLDRVKFLIIGTTYTYEVSGDVRVRIERVAKWRPWKALNTAKKFGELIVDLDKLKGRKTKPINIRGCKLYSCDDEDSLLQEIDRSFNKHHG